MNPFKSKFKRMIPPPIPEGEAKRLDARKRAETKAEQVALKSETNNEARPKETGGPTGLEPTRYGDWEKAGRCFDF